MQFLDTLIGVVALVKASTTKRNMLSSAPSYRSTKLLVGLMILFGASFSHATPITYSWDFNAGGTNGDGNFSFVEDEIFSRLTDGEVDIFVRQDGTTIGIESSTLAFTFDNGGILQTETSTVLSTAPDCSSVSEPFMPGCLDELESDKIRFQHYFLDIDDAFGLDEEDVVEASLTIVGTGLDFSNPDLRIRWDWNDIETLPRTTAVPEPAPLALLLLSLMLLAVSRFFKRLRAKNPTISTSSLRTD